VVAAKSAGTTEPSAFAVMQLDVCAGSKRD
jgi:hypothetical protein